MTKEYNPKLTEAELTSSISKLGIKKANTRFWHLILLGTLAGLYIALGAQVFLVALEQGMGKIVGGVVFSVGLVLVVVAGAELFTGNIIMLVGSFSRLFPVTKLLKNWSIVYLSNFFGAAVTAFLIYKSGLMGSPGDPNGLGQLSISIAENKLALSFGQAFIRGFLCNILVVLAIILASFSKDVISKIFSIVIPIMAFVAAGFEHCVANMYLIPIGLLSKGAPFSEFWTIFTNIGPVTLGNIAGGITILLIHPNRIRQVAELLKRRKSSTTPKARGDNKP